MLHMLIRTNTHIPQHLHRLSILNLNMLLLHHRLHKVLMDELPESAPLLTILHNQQMVSGCHEIVRDIRLRPVAVFGALLVD